MSALIQPDLIRASLGALDLEQPLPTSAQPYQQFYGLDLPQQPETQSRLGIVQVQDYEVVTQLWWPLEPQATLIILHGYYDHMGLYRHLVDWALKLGFCVLSCDLPGHGLSSGARASIRSFDEYQQVLQALLHEARRLKLPTPWHLLGQSTGAAIITDYLVHPNTDPEIGRSILMAPLVRPCDWLRAQWLYWLMRPFVQGIARRFTANSGDTDFLNFVQTQDPLQPRVLPTAWVGALSRWIPQIEQAPQSPHQPLIIQGEQDCTVDWQYNLPVLQQKFQNPTILQLPEARHHLANERNDIRQEYLTFLQQELH